MYAIRSYYVLLKSRIGWRSSIAAGFLLNTHLSIEVAIAVIGEQLGLITPATSAAIIVFAVLTVILMPIIFNIVQPKSQKKPGHLIRLIYGWENNISRSVAQQLISAGDQVKFLTHQPMVNDVINRDVITSYSIHYTKLYEAPLRVFCVANPPPMSIYRIMVLCLWNVRIASSPSLEAALL